MHITLIKYILASRIRTWLLVISTGLFWYILNFVWPTPKLLEYGSRKIFPDLVTSGYDVSYVQNLFVSYGEMGRNYYRTFLLTGDIVFPVLYSLFFGILLWLAIRNTRISDRWKHSLALLPFIAAIFDYLENICMLLTLALFPNIYPVIVQLGSLFTIGKNSLSVIGMITLIGFGLYNGIILLGRKK